MKVPLSWLRDFTPVDDDPDALADVFNSLGLVVEGVEHVGKGLDGVVVARVLDVRAHPNADLVRLADVDLGDGETVQIACAGVNLAAGQLVPVIKVGATLPNGMTIERRKMRGEWSNGMICSSEEVGLPADGPKEIMVLPNDLELGADFATAMGIESDTVFDLEIETNRPDAMCVAGIARDIAGKLALPFSIPEPQVNETRPEIDPLAKIEVKDTALCPRFTARVITGIEVGPSPDLVSRRLTLAGMRPINNVVDASNYVMLELGQPSHPYDLARLDGNGLIVRTSREGEVIETLDGSQRKLPTGAGVIADTSDRVVSVAGIMGGASSEIGESTTDVLIEAAVWEPYSINKTSRQLALRTDASARFERRVDRRCLTRAQNRIVELLQQTSPNLSIASGIIDVDHSAPWPSPAEKLPLRTKRVNAILGTELTSEQINGYLTRIGFDAGNESVVVPSFRPDVEREIDVIEEVARIHGYDNIERRVPTSPSAARLTRYQQQRRRIKAALAGRGLSESWTASMLGPDDFTKSGLIEQPVRVANPMTQEDSLLRTSMLPGMLRALAYNASRRNNVVKLFEIGHVFHQPPAGQTLPDEREMLAIAILDTTSDAMSAAYLARDLAFSLGVRSLNLMPSQSEGLHPTRTAAISGETGVIGEIDPDVLARYGIEGRVGWVEVDLARVVETIEVTPQMIPVSRYPSAEFDLAIVVENNITAETVFITLMKALGELCEDVTLFDVFRGGKLDANARSLAFRLRIAARDRTLGEEEIAATRRAAIAAVESEHGATLRA